MGHWGGSGTHHGDDAGADRPADAPRLPPMRLSTHPDDADDERTDTGTPDDLKAVRRWLGFGLALVVGAVAGVVGANARHDAVERAQVDLIGGQTTLARPASSGPDGTSWQAEFLVFNPGTRPVEIVDIHVDGWVRPDDTRQDRSPITADPEEWTVFRSELRPDCSVEPSFADADASLIAETTIRTDTSETETLTLMFAPGQSWLKSAWTSICTSTMIPYPDIAVVATEILPSDEGVSSVRARLHLATASGERHAAVLRIWSHVPGFGFAPNGLPVAVRGEEPAPLELEWEIASCKVAERLEEARLGFHVAPDVDSRTARVQNVEVPAAVLVALGRLTAEVCGL